MQLFALSALLSSVVAEALHAYLERLDLQDFNISEYSARLVRSNYTDVPVISLAISGGGWGSAFTGTEAICALDNRLPSANTQRTGGLLQSFTYISGLSGGSFPTISFAVHNFPTADEIVKIWRPEINRLFGVQNNTSYAPSATCIFEDIAAKAKAGFNVGVSDYLARAFAYEFVAGPENDVNSAFSDVVEKSKFKTHQMPFPLLEAAEVVDGDVEYFGIKVPYPNTTFYEITPYEFGAWNGTVKGFTPTEYLGTRLKNGSPVNSSECVRNFDSASYLMGTSGGAFNFWYIEDLSNGTLAPFPKRSRASRTATKSHALSKRASFPIAVLDLILQTFKEYFSLNVTQILYSTWPNPFFHSSASSKASPVLNLVDGSESLQAIPFWGLIQPLRTPSFIIAWDDNEDAAPYNWNNGTNVYNTYLAANRTGIPFPIVPPAATMMNRNYTTRPVLFGCDTRLTTTGDARAPIVLYMANAPYSAFTNYSYTQANTSRAQMYDIFVNSFNQFTQGNGTLDAEWTMCLGCAAIDRSLVKVGMKRTARCESCMSKWCWDGAFNESKPEPIDPVLLLTGERFLEWNATNPF